MVANRFGCFQLGLAGKWLAARQRFVADNRQREDIGGRRAGLQIDLLRRHVLKRTFEPCYGIGPDQMDNPEVDDLYRIVIHHEDVAGLQVAVDHALLMRGLKAAARLCDDPHDALQREPRTGGLHQLFERRAGQKRHDEERPSLVFLIEFPCVEYVDDVRMAQMGEHRPFFVEQFQCGRAQRSAHALERYVAFGGNVVCLVNNTHATLTHGLTAELVPAVDEEA